MAVESRPAPYRRRHPETTALYQVVQQHLETYLALAGEEDRAGQPVPAYVEREFRRYLQCGILAYGFARARCPDCGHDFLVAFSCKGRGLCPSCNARRMAETAAHRVDHVFPPLPVRQWVLAVPKRLRWYLEREPRAIGAVLHILLRVIAAHLRQGSIDHLAALIPPPRRHRHRYHGVLAPNAPLRAATVVLGRDPRDDPRASAELAAPRRAPAPNARSPARYLWAMLLARLFESLPLVCPNCSADMRLIAFVIESAPVQRILAHTGEPTEPPPLAPARGPPGWDDDPGPMPDWDLLGQPEPDVEFDQRLSW